MSAEELAPNRILSTEPRVSIVAVGDAGNNLLGQAIGNGLRPDQCTAVNSDRNQLSRSPARNKVLLERPHTDRGETLGPDARNNLSFSTQRVTPFTESSDFTIVVAGLGGETGTGAAPLIAHWSRSRVRPVVSVVAIPFIHERERRFIALRGLKKMVDACDCTIVIDNSAESGTASLEGRSADRLASLAVGGLTEVVSQMNPVRKQEFRRVVSLGPIATLCFAPVRAGDTVQSTVLAALKNPSARFPIDKTRGGFLIYRGPREVSDGYAAQAYEALASLAGHDIDFSYGSIRTVSEPSICLLLTGYEYGTAVQAFVEFIEDLYDIEYGQTGGESLVRVQMPLFQMEQA